MPDRKESLLKLLKNPPPEYRSAPFWAWNDKLDTRELSRQIADMARQGAGGLFIHSREGLETEYLSEEWMRCVEVSVSEAREQGVEIWIYDEDKWPSGSAGGKVSRSHPRDFTAKAVTAELFEGETPDLVKKYLDACFCEPELLGVYSLVLDSEGYLQGYEKIQWKGGTPLVEEGSRAFLLCRMETSGTSEWYNHRAPSDTLNPRAVQNFLEITHRKYEQKLGQEFGKTIKGFFTDEPNFCDFFSTFTPGRPWLPWSQVFPEFFQKNRGYDPAGILPLLFFHGRGEEKARYDFWLTLTELFSQSYMKQLYQWCDERNLELTGHVLYENDLGYSVRVSGASMPHYRYMHAPGIDILGDQRQEYLTVKQCTSVANQYGRKTAVSETYGCTGWDFSFEGQKRVGDWQFVMGINRRCQHLALYSFSGCRKRDYPPSFNYHNGWWEHNRILEDYFARLSLCVSLGDVIRDILMIHPMSSFWMQSGSDMKENLGRVEMNMGWTDEHIIALNRQGDSLNRLVKDLLQTQLDFDFGDELIMRDDAFVRDGVITVGIRTYNRIIVPPVSNLMSSTVDLLESFLDTGGSVFWMGSLPGLVDAQPSGRISALKDHPHLSEIRDTPHLLETLGNSSVRPVRVCGESGNSLSGFLSMVRKSDTIEIITLVNTRKESLDTVLHFDTVGKLSRYDLFTGKVSRVRPVRVPGTAGMAVQTTFSPEESCVYLLDTSLSPSLKAFQPAYRHPHRTEQLAMSFPPSAPVSLSMENALILDTGRFRVDNESWGEEMQIWQGQKALRERFGMPPVYYNGAPQRYTWIQTGKWNSHKVSMLFSFVLESPPVSPLFAAVEKSGNYRVSCNGEPCIRTGEYYLDRSLLKHQLTDLKVGENLLQIDLDYTGSIELEDIYLTGDFGVSPARRIVPPVRHLRWGDWTLQGLLHYPGSVRYHYSLPFLDKKAEGRRLFLKTGAFGGTLLLVRINGSGPLPVLGDDAFIEVTGLFRYDRENLVDLEVAGSLRNLLGPFHRSFTSCSRISWEDFRTEGAAYTPEYRVVPMGLMGEAALVYDLR